MKFFMDISVLDSCQNIEETYGEICVHCNACGRFNDKDAALPYQPSKELLKAIDELFEEK